MNEKIEQIKLLLEEIHQEYEFEDSDDMEDFEIRINNVEFELGYLEEFVNTADDSLDSLEND